jgi:hypothetical protein
MTQSWNRQLLTPLSILAAATVACALLSPPPAVAAITLGSPIQVPWLNGFQSPTTVAVLKDGSFGIATIDSFLVSDTEVATALAAQFFRPDGAPQTQPSILIRPPAVVTAAGIASVGDRYFLVVGGARRTYARFYNEEGAPLGSSIRWPNGDFEYYGSAPLFRFLSITHHVTSHDQDGNPIYTAFVQVADADGLLLGVPVELPVPASELPVQDAAINGKGRFVVVEQPCTPSSCTVGIQIFDSAVRPLTPLLSAGVPQPEEPGGVINSQAATAINNQGEVLLVWRTHIENPFGEQLDARVFDETGAPASEVIKLAAPVDSALGGILVPTALNDGSFLVAWEIQSERSLTITVFMERIDPATTTTSEPTVLAEGDLRDWLLSVNDSGKGVIVWQTEEGFAAYLRTIRVRP